MKRKMVWTVVACVVGAVAAGVTCEGVLALMAALEGRGDEVLVGTLVFGMIVLALVSLGRRMR